MNANLRVIRQVMVNKDKVTSNIPSKHESFSGVSLKKARLDGQNFNNTTETHSPRNS